MAAAVARLFKVSSANKIGVLPRPDVEADVSAYLAAGAVFVAVGEWEDPASGRSYLQLARGRGWIAMCSRKDFTRSVVAEVEGAAEATGDAASRLFTVISENRVGVLQEADIRAEVSAYMAAGSVFFVAEVHTDPDDGRTFLQLANRNGWVPKCSRKDPNKLVVEEIEEFGPSTTRTAVESIAEEGQTRPAPGTFEEPCRKRPRQEAVVDVKGSAIAKDASLLPSRMTKLTALVAQMFSRLRRQELPLDELLDGLRGDFADTEEMLTMEELQAAMSHLEQLNKVFFQEGSVILIS